MVAEARRLHGSETSVRFEAGIAPPQPCDYAVASGIFNIRLAHEMADWQLYMEEMVTVMNRSARRGFAFNCLTSYSDAERMQPHLHYGDPLAWFDFCKRNFARSVALLHDYGLWEWTLIVRKDR